MPLEHLQLLAVFQADDVIVLYRRTHRNGGFGQRFCLRFGRLQPGERSIDVGDQCGQVAHGDAVVADMGSDDIRSEGDQRFTQIDICFCHCEPAFFL